MQNRYSFAILLAWACCATAQAVEINQPMPHCDVKPIDEAQADIDFSQYRGKVVYVDFWASWCGPCAKSFPFMNELNRDLRDRGLEIIGISVDETVADAKKFLAKRPGTFSLALDSSGACPRAYDVQAMPSSYFIDRQGKVRYVHVGFKAGDAAEIRAMAEQLLAEHSTASAQ